MIGGAVAATAGVTSLSIGASAGPAAGADTPPRTAPAGGEVKRLTLYAENLADGKLGYGFEKGRRRSPAR